MEHTAWLEAQRARGDTPREAIMVQPGVRDSKAVSVISEEDTGYDNM